MMHIWTDRMSRPAAAVALFARNLATTHLVRGDGLLRTVPSGFRP